MAASEIDRDALLLPVAVAGWIGAGVFPRRRTVPGVIRRLGERRRLAEVSRRFEVLRPFHDVNMGKDRFCAKR